MFLDARELAKAIYDQSITNPDYAGFYKQFFPRFSADLDNHEYYGKLPPPCSGYIHAEITTRAIKRHLQSQPICVLYGISGSGKTEAAIDYVRRESDGFENYIWISGDDWKKDTSLSSVQRTRGGTPINVAGIFNRGKCVLVIDSLERTLDPDCFNELKSGLENGGAILITSQVSAPGDSRYLAIPELSTDVAAQILGEDHKASATAVKFISKCKFSPLILSIAKSIIRQGGFPPEELYQEVLTSPVTIPNNGQSIIRKILERLDPDAYKALESIANSEVCSHDLGFLGHFIGIGNCRKLQQCSILVPTGVPNIFRIHDLISEAVRSKSDAVPLTKSIESYIDKHRGDMPPSVLRQIHLARRPIDEEHQRRGPRPSDWLTYALLQIDSDKKMIICQELNTSEITDMSSLQEVMCLIDAKEADGYKIENWKERANYFSECEKLYQQAFSQSSNEEIKAELLHHRGKALRRTGHYKDALQCFAELLELKTNWHATHLQIAHLGMQITTDPEIKSASAKSMKILLDAVLENSSSVPLRVSLAALTRLRSYRDVAAEISNDAAKVSQLADVIASAALEGFHQFHEAFLSFTSVFSYRHSTCCIELAEKLSDMLSLPPDVVEKEQWVSACEGLANTSIAASRADKEVVARELGLAGARFADAINEQEFLKSYDARAIAKTYIVAGLPENALRAIAKVEAKHIDHWLLYRKAEAERMLGKKEALSTAKQALDLALDDPKAKNRVSTYHDLLSKCYESAGQRKEALLEARNALEKCEDNEYSNNISIRINRLEGEQA